MAKMLRTYYMDAPLYNMIAVLYTSAFIEFRKVFDSVWYISMLGPLRKVG